MRFSFERCEVSDHGWERVRRWKESGAIPEAGKEL